MNPDQRASASPAIVPAGLSDALPVPPPCGADGPVFREPWEAQVFAIVLALHQRGLFEWPEWAAFLSAAIRQAQAEGDPDKGDTYYRHWLVALERLVTDKGLAAPLALSALRQAWRVAAERTPHGQAIQLPGGVIGLSQAG